MKRIILMNKVVRTHNHIAFCIYEFEFSPDKVTELLQMTPTEVRVKGEYRTVGKLQLKIPNKENGWILKSNLLLTDSVESHLKHLLKKIKEHKQAVVGLTSNYYAEFACGLYFHEINPGIHLDCSLLREISDLNINLDLDMYCLSDK